MRLKNTTAWDTRDLGKFFRKLLKEEGFELSVLEIHDSTTKNSYSIENFRNGMKIALPTKNRTNDTRLKQIKGKLLTTIAQFFIYGLRYKTVDSRDMNHNYRMIDVNYIKDYIINKKPKSKRPIVKTYSKCIDKINEYEKKIQNLASEMLKDHSYSEISAMITKQKRNKSYLKKWKAKKNYYKRKYPEVITDTDKIKNKIKSFLINNKE